MKKILFFLLLLFLIAVEILRVYFIMPFPGSQQQTSLQFAYWLGKNIIWIRILLLAAISYPLLSTLQLSKRLTRYILAGSFAIYAVVFYFVNFRFLADKMFYQPRTKTMQGVKNNSIAKDKLILGLVINGEARAYPIQLIGYHHQVRDTVGGESVLVTYCTVCRTGRFYSSQVNGKEEQFRLVGMDHFNALFEDASTKSWWRQVNGAAVAGPLTGQQLREIPSQQMTLAAWLRQYPSSTILQPDTIFREQYDELKAFDKGTVTSKLEKRDSLSWQRKSWVVGIKTNNAAKAIDWNELVKKRVIEDSLPNLPFLLVLDDDFTSFYCYNRNVLGTTLRFEAKQVDKQWMLFDTNTGSTWNLLGKCLSGKYQNTQLSQTPAYQEFWHSWLTFQPNTTK
ncbi:MAG: DUF3179 domain-containing (seleno)protein [Chitinophagia bacterium]